MLVVQIDPGRILNKFWKPFAVTKRGSMEGFK